MPRLIIMFNPSREKGGHIFRQIARAMPDRRFGVVPGWNSLRKPDGTWDQTTVRRSIESKGYRQGRSSLRPYLLRTVRPLRPLSAGLLRKYNTCCVETTVDNLWITWKVWRIGNTWRWLRVILVISWVWPLLCVPSSVSERSHVA